MKRWPTILLSALALLLATTAAGNPVLVPSYGWEDGGTVLGMVGHRRPASLSPPT